MVSEKKMESETSLKKVPDANEIKWNRMPV